MYHKINLSSCDDLTFYSESNKSVNRDLTNLTSDFRETSTGHMHFLTTNF